MAAAIVSVQFFDEAGGLVRLIDQTLLPGTLTYRDCRTVEDVWEAIKTLRVRGAPAIGVAAAMGVVLGVRECRDGAGFERQVAEVCSYLRTSRPTAVNLFWALDRMERLARGFGPAVPLADRRARLLSEAIRIQEEDQDMCAAIGAAGEGLIADGSGVLTHCNTGALATAGAGTALAVLTTAAGKGRRFQVFADETRPLLQGARLTAWELKQQSVPVTVICDSMAGQVMKEGRVQLVIVGADRITANGDTANKIGTYSVAVLARRTASPFTWPHPPAPSICRWPPATASPLNSAIRAR